MGDFDDMKGMSESLAKRVDAGMGCGSFILDGWRDIILKLDEDIAKLDPNYRVDQIKEKFGGLRYYISLSRGTTNEELSVVIYELVREAEDRSMVTCDVCGKEGTRKTQSRGFVATRCEDHES